MVQGGRTDATPAHAVEDAQQRDIKARVQAALDKLARHPTLQEPGGGNVEEEDASPPQLLDLSSDKVDPVLDVFPPTVMSSPPGTLSLSSPVPITPGCPVSSTAVDPRGCPIIPVIVAPITSVTIVHTCHQRSNVRAIETPIEAPQ